MRSYQTLKEGGCYRYSPEESDDGIPLRISLKTPHENISDFFVAEMLIQGDVFLLLEKSVRYLRDKFEHSYPFFQMKILTNKGVFYVIVNTEYDPYSANDQFEPIVE